MQKLATTLFTSHMAAAHLDTDGVFDKLHAFLDHAEEVYDKA